MIILATVSSEDKHVAAVIGRWAADEDYAQSASHRREDRKRDFLLARSALRALLIEMTGDGNWSFRPDINGKPHVFTSSGKPGPHISLSHTRGSVACAVSHNGPIGIDIECWRARDFHAIAAYAFGPKERQEVESEGISAFYRIWTAREAAAKMTGIGILALLDSIDHAAGITASEWSSVVGGKLLSLNPKPSYSLAIAVAENVDIQRQTTETANTEIIGRLYQTSSFDFIRHL